MTSVEKIAKKVGGLIKLGRLARVHKSTPYRWTVPVKQGGTAGVIPQRHQKAIIKNAAKLGITIKPIDFFG